MRVQEVIKACCIFINTLHRLCKPFFAGHELVGLLFNLIEVRFKLCVRGGGNHVVSVSITFVFRSVQVLFFRFCFDFFLVQHLTKYSNVNLAIVELLLQAVEIHGSTAFG